METIEAADPYCDRPQICAIQTNGMLTRIEEFQECYWLTTTSLANIVSNATKFVLCYVYRIITYSKWEMKF